MNKSLPSAHRFRAMPAAMLASLLLLVPPFARAEPPDVFRRLMAEPLTLFDWGLAQLDRDIAAAGRQALRRRPAVDAPRTGAFYERRAGKITMYVTAALPRAERTDRNCTVIFSNVINSLIEGAPAGPDAAGWYLLNAFLPQAHYWGSRFEDIGTKLLAKVRLDVSLIPATFEMVHGDTRRVRCTGRLDADSDEITVDVTS